MQQLSPYRCSKMCSYMGLLSAAPSMSVDLHLANLNMAALPPPRMCVLVGRATCSRVWTEGRERGVLCIADCYF
jgi:hypothetical protein